MKVSLREITLELTGRLWNAFSKRVPYACVYNEIVTTKNGISNIDHIAFRTLNTHTGEQPEGIKAIGHIIQSLEYKPAGQYEFPRKKLTATCYQHPNRSFPKIFVSQLEVEKLPFWAQTLIKECVAETPYLLSDTSIELMNSLKINKNLTREAAQALVNDLVRYFRRPWVVPSKESVLKINDVSHYAAWVLLYGNSVSHFSGLVNNQDVNNFSDIEVVCKALSSYGVPMKNIIEGEKGSKLRQSATQATIEEVDVIGENGIETILWPYGYYGLVQRGFVGKNNKRRQFQGFLVDQARHLFDITNTLEN